jgi:hypothetical protein
MSADFSRVAAHLAANLEEHAERDGLTGVRRAVFIDRGRHAVGEVCPSELPPRPDRKWCYTCERFHSPMEWGDGCTDQVAEAVGYSRSHHRILATAAGTWGVARPLRDTSWWRRHQAERACRKTLGHCWHPEGLIDWWCCACSGETDGMPEQRCKVCAPEVTDGR